MMYTLVPPAEYVQELYNISHDQTRNKSVWLTSCSKFPCFKSSHVASNREENHIRLPNTCSSISSCNYLSSFNNLKRWKLLVDGEIQYNLISASSHTTPQPKFIYSAFHELRSTDRSRQKFIRNNKTKTLEKLFLQLKSQWNTLYHIPLALRFVLQKITMHNTVLRCHTQGAKTPSYTDKYEYKKEGLCPVEVVSVCTLMIFDCLEINRHI